MKNKKIAIILIINILLLYFYTIYCYAATDEIYYNGFKMLKRYNTPTEPVYWISGLTIWKTSKIVVPAVANDNIEIKAIYDNTKASGVFQSNIWLETVDLSESNIETIGTYCFYNCISLTDYINSPNLKEICGYAFQNANLNSLTLNDGLESIKISAFEDAFSNEKSVHVIDIPDSVTSIGENAFKVTNKNYRVVLVGQKDSVAEEYCKSDLTCTFIERGAPIPTEEELIQEEIKKEKSKLFINTKFTYGNYNNTDKPNTTRYFGLPASSVNSDMLETYNDIIKVEDGLVVVGDSYLHKYDFSNEYLQDIYGNQVKGNQDAIIVKYDYNLDMKWIQSFGGSLNDQFHRIYKTKDGGYLLFGVTSSNDKDLLNINYNTSTYSDVVVKYDENFKIIETKIQTHEEAYEEYKDIIIDDDKGNISNGKIELNTISDGKLGVVQGINGYEMNTLINKYDNEGYLEWTKLFDKDTNHTNDRLVKTVEVEDGYVFIGSSSKTAKNSHNVEIFQQDAIIVKYNKPYDQIIINGILQFDMNVNEQKSVDVFYVPWEDVTIGEMQWTSENEEVATVDYKGNIYAKSEGSTKITLNIRGKTQQLFVNVTDPTLLHIENIELNTAELSLNKDESQTLIATITPTETTDDKKITWTSSDTNIVTVDEQGNIIAIAEGTAIITAGTVNGKKATCTVVVNDFSVGDINGDNKINIKDWNKMYEYINETSELTKEEFERGDVNKDGKVNIKDWNRIYDHIREVNPLW